MAGYLGAIPVPQATQHRETFTATSGQTTFNTAGYTVGFLDVYLNGSHLSPADFTATNGSDVVLASGASTGDVCDIISYTAFEIADQTFTGTTTMDVAAITGVLTTTAATVFNGGFASNAASTITTADNTTQLTLASTDTDANVGPVLDLYRNSASPADSDVVGRINFKGENSAGESIDYAYLTGIILDVTDGTEDGYIAIRSMLAGSDVPRITMDGTETVFNDASVDLDFRVESNGNANMLFVDGGNDAVGIGTASAGAIATANSRDGLVVGSGGGNNGVTIYSGNTSNSSIMFADATSGSGTYIGQINYDHNADAMLFSTAATERMRIDSSGNLGIGNTVASSMDGGANNLVIGSGSGTEGMTIYSGNANSGTIYFADGSSGDDRFRGQIGYGHGDNSLSFRTNASSTPDMTIDSTGAVTMPHQPAFQAVPSSTQFNIAINSQVTIVFGTEVFDQNADFASNTFTAPVTGKYQLNVSIYVNNLDTGADYYTLSIKTSNRTYENVMDPGVLASDPVYWTQTLSILADMDASDTAYIFLQQGNGTVQTDITTQSRFSGYLAC